MYAVKIKKKTNLQGRKIESQHTSLHQAHHCFSRNKNWVSSYQFSRTATEFIWEKTLENGWSVQRPWTEQMVSLFRYKPDEFGNRVHFMLCLFKAVMWEMKSWGDQCYTRWLWNSCKLPEREGPPHRRRTRVQVLTAHVPSWSAWVDTTQPQGLGLGLHCHGVCDLAQKSHLSKSILQKYFHKHKEKLNAVIQSTLSFEI